MRTIIEMLNEAAIGHPDYDLENTPRLEGDDLAFYKRFVKLVRADEREACAKLCEEQYEYYGHDHVFAAAIRARGNK